MALGLGLTLLLISLGLLDGSQEQMIGNAVRFGTGHVVIQAQGYQRSGSQELLLSAANADGVDIMGVIPIEERTVSLIPQRIVEGAYLGDDQQSGIVIGTDL